MILLYFDYILNVCEDKCKCGAQSGRVKSTGHARNTKVSQEV